MIAKSNISVQFAMPKLAVYRVNLKTGAAIPVESGNVQTTGFLLGASGEVVARIDVNDRNNRWWLFVPDGDKERMILEDVTKMGMPMQFFGLLEDGRIAAVNQHEDGARDTLLAIDR